MDSQANSFEERVRRCAVCKIDLKGRFVYIDDDTAGLLGFTKEELFGRLFLDFLHPDDHAIIEKVLQRRNHYEAYFETLRISLVSRDNNVIATDAVISLNFIAGNPVNFQFIFNPCTGPDDHPGRSTGRATGTDGFDSFVRTLLSVRGDLDWPSICRELRQVCGADLAAVYLCRERSCEIPPEVRDDLLYDPTPLNELHFDVIDSGIPYDFAHEEQVRRAVEKCGSAPNEFLARIPFGEETFLLRMLFPDQLDGAVAAQAMQRTHTAHELLSVLIGDGRQLRDEQIEASFRAPQSPAIAANVTRCQIYHDTTALSEILRSIRALVSSIASAGEKLAHEHIGELSRNGNVFLQAIQQEGQKLQRMLSEVTELVEMTGEVHDDEPVDVNLLVSQLLADLSGDYPQVKIDTKTGDLPKLQSDRRLLSAVLQTVLGNAVKCAGQKVTIDIQATSDQDAVYLRIRDNGPGIDRKTRSKLFEFFHTGLVDTGSRNPVSLAAARQLMRSLGGDLEIESESGQGTVVTLSIPNQLGEGQDQ